MWKLDAQLAVRSAIAFYFSPTAPQKQLEVISILWNKHLTDWSSKCWNIAQRCCKCWRMRPEFLTFMCILPQIAVLQDTPGLLKHTEMAQVHWITSSKLFRVERVFKVPQVHNSHLKYDATQTWNVMLVMTLHLPSDKQQTNTFLCRLHIEDLNNGNSE